MYTDVLNAVQWGSNAHYHNAWWFDLEHEQGQPTRDFRERGQRSAQSTHLRVSTLGERPGKLS
eukprot:7368045-Heterocapsa_arctica.AAC.1